MKQTSILTILLILSLSISANSPRKIRCKTDYIQPESNITFPNYIKDFERMEIYSFNKTNTDVGVNYQRKNLTEVTDLSIYVYPAGIAVEDRLRAEYLHSLQEIANTTLKGINATQSYTSFSQNGYKVNGFKAEITQKENSFLSVYECGEWFFKIRITSNQNDFAEILNLEQDILKLFVPTKLVELAPLAPLASIKVSTAAQKDSLIFECMLFSALEKSKWVKEHVDSLEKAAGFPGIYLDMYVDALMKISEHAKMKTKMQRSATTTDYLSDLNLIIDSGFLKEFILDQFSMLMTTPENTEFNFDGFFEWKKNHDVKLNLNQMYYLIYFKKQKEK